MTQILPGGTIGIIGGGQLGRMTAFEAKRMGYRVVVLDPDPGGPAAQVADHCIEGGWDDPSANEALAVESDVITLDTEHVPADILDMLAKETIVRPSADVLRIIQDRFEQRRFLSAHSAPQPAHALIENLESLQRAATKIGFPCVIKTRSSGYDGKGQARAVNYAGLENAWHAIGDAPATLEAFIDFEKEISVLLARGPDGKVSFYPVAENEHRQHVLHITRAPANVTSEVAAEATMLAERIASALGYIGIMAVEMFVTREGALLVNEIAPRPHNSGHYTFGACATSQFEQHVRAICGLPLGKTSLLRPSAVMVNLFGDLWQNGPPDWRGVLSQPSTRLHLYGKSLPKPGRKMGHVLIFEENEGQTPENIASDIMTSLERSVHAR